MTNVTAQHGTRAIIDGRRCYFGTVAGYATENRESALEAVQRARRHGHDLQWINLACTVICGDEGYYERDRAEWSDALVLSVGDTVWIDGEFFTIHPAPNRNFALRAKG